MWEGYTVPFQSGKEKPEVPTIILLTFFLSLKSIFIVQPEGYYIGSNKEGSIKKLAKERRRGKIFKNL